MESELTNIKTNIATLSANMEAVKETLHHIEKLDEKQTRILELLATNKTEHAQFQAEIRNLIERTHGIIDCEVAIPHMRNDINRLDSKCDHEIDKLWKNIAETDKRIAAIEVSIAQAIGKATGISITGVLLIGWIGHLLGWVG